MKDKWLSIFFLFIPFLAHSEITWQGQANGARIELHLSNDRATIPEPIEVTALFRFPETYEFNVEQAIDQLLLHVNPLVPIWKVVNKKIYPLEQDGGYKSQNIYIQLIANFAGIHTLTFGKIDFQPIKKDLPSFSILTPPWQIKALNPLPSSVEFAPLIPLEPKYPLYLSSQNRQTLFLDPARMAEEEARNIRLIKAHTFPWFSLLGVLALAGGFWCLKQYRNRQLQKEIDRKNQLAQKLELVKQLEGLKPDPRLALERDRYLLLSNLLEKQLLKLFTFHVSDYTAEEVVSAVNFSNIPPEIQSKLQSILLENYYVKYAAKQPSTNLYNDTYQLVHQLLDSY